MKYAVSRQAFAIRLDSSKVSKTLRPRRKNIRAARKVSLGLLVKPPYLAANLSQRDEYFERRRLDLAM